MKGRGSESANAPSWGAYSELGAKVILFSSAVGRNVGKSRVESSHYSCHLSKLSKKASCRSHRLKFCFFTSPANERVAHSVFVVQG